LKSRIRDFFITRQGWIFAVADYSHPHGLRSLLRYIPDPAGERQREGRRYRKLDFDDAFIFLRRERPEWVLDLHTVPDEEVVHIFQPAQGLDAVAGQDERVAKIAAILEDGGVPRQQMGITGSMLIGLHGPASDIDFVVYGPHWWLARRILEKAKSQGRIDDLDEATWKKIYQKRKPEIGFDEFMLHEKRKGNRGMVDGTYFDLLFTRDWSQIQIEKAHSSPGKVVGEGRISAQVVDADFAFDSPAIFKLDHPQVKEIFCYSHTYAGQALPREVIEAKGVLEETAQGLRLVVGTTREARGEWIRSLSLLESEKQQA